MKLSVFIPMDYTQLFRLSDIVDIYNSGSLIPDEIVISVVGVDNEEGINVLRGIHSKKYPNVYIYAGKALATIAENRRNALKFTKGDIISFHDASKYPSYRRLEAIVTCFDTHDVVALHHSYHSWDVFYDNDISFDNTIVVDSATMFKRYFPFNDISTCWRFSRTYGQEFSIKTVDMESITIRRETLDKITWKEPFEISLYNGNGNGIFYEFAMEILYTYNRSMIFDLPLTIVK